MSGFFGRNFDKLRINAEGFRNCQRGAYWAALSHFTISNKPCLIGMPTGSGKTAVMMAVAFGLKAQRVLIITPATILRHQTASKFSKLDDLRLLEAVPKSLGNPKVMEATREFQSADDWKDCLAYDVVVATTKTTSPKEKRVSPAPPGTFDLLFVDEAHHAPASTWAALVEGFEQSRTRSILLTGTPYRRDRIEIKADLIYDYPIGRAISDGVFAPVKFASAGLQTASRDTKLAKKGLRVREKLIEDFEEIPLLLIKTDRINHAKELAELYQELGANVVAIHSDLPEDVNRETIKKLASQEIDGIVAVGMVGEGLDVPLLKLAIFHRNPQSLPHTIQLIGRLARAGTKFTQGVVVGFVDDFSRETFRLYDASPDWLALIPAMEKKLMSGRVGESTAVHIEEGENFLFDSDITPFYTVTAFRWLTSPKSANIDAVGRWERHSEYRQETIERVSVVDNDTVVVISKRKSQPNWIKSGGYSRALQEQYDLHVFFQSKELVLQYSTNDQSASQIRSTLFDGPLEYVGRETLSRVLQSGAGSYLVVGLKNSGAFSHANPSYKMLLGNEAQSAVSSADTKVFHAGHCLMRLSRDDRDSEVRGIAYRKSRVWALRRDNLKDFRNWCMSLTEAMRANGDAQLPGLERLRKFEKLDEFSIQPLAIVHNTSLLTKRVAFVPAEDETGAGISGLPDTSVDGFKDGRVEFSLGDLGIRCWIELDEAGEATYSFDADDSYTVTVDPEVGTLRRFSLTEFMEEYPPRLIFPDGSTVVDGFYSRPVSIPELESGDVSAIDWIGCDINSEIDDTNLGISVQNFIETKYISDQDKQVLIVHDHEAREIADTIAVDLVTRHIRLIHAKSAAMRAGKRQKPGGRKADLEVVLSQAICSGRWVKHVDFAAELSRRLEERDATKIVRGKQNQLQEFATSYSPPLYSFEVIVAQPATRSDLIKGEIKAMIASAQDYIKAAGARFSLICSDQAS